MATANTKKVVEEVEVQEEAPVQKDANQLLAEILAQAIASGNQALVAQIQATQPTRKVPFNQYKPVTPFNPEGKKNRKLTRRSWQNGREFNTEFMYDEEIAMLNAIVKPGRYIKGESGRWLVEVIIKEEDNGEQTLRLKYDLSREGRNEMKGECRNFRAILKRILEEQDSK